MEPTLQPGASLYDRYEGIGHRNDCKADIDCVASGCSGEICAAESLASTCEVVPMPPGSCHCVNDLCLWSRPCEWDSVLRPYQNK